MSAVCFAFGWAGVGARASSTDNRASAVRRSVLPLIGLAEVAVLTAHLSLAIPIGLAANIMGAVVARSACCWSADGVCTICVRVGCEALPVAAGKWRCRWWFQPAALFGVRFLLPHRTHALMAFVVFWGFCCACGGLRQWVGGGAGRTPSNLFWPLVILPLVELGNYIVSDSGDEPVADFLLVTLPFGCRYIMRQSEVRGNRWLIIIAIAILALFAVGLNWSAVLLAAAFTRQRAYAAGWPLLVGVSALGVPMLAPKLLRSVIPSGYPVYPFPCLDWFDATRLAPGSRSPIST